MLSRRLMLQGAATLALAGPGPGRAESAGGAQTIRLSILQFGSAAWELAALGALGLDRAQGLTLDLRRAANNDAGRLAFLAGAADAVVSDLLWAARMKADGRSLVYLPFSSGEGAVMVPPGSRLRELKDLSGARLGVAGGPLDKSWLLLKAHARATAGIDLTQVANLSFGAPPLLAAQLAQGDLDAALIYWTFCARLEPKGFTRLIDMAQVLAAFGIAPPPALVGYVFDGEFARRSAPALNAFAVATQATRAVLAGGAGAADAKGDAKTNAETDAKTDAAWAAARPMMQAGDDATFAALRRGYVAGIPSADAARDRAAAARLIATLADAGGSTLLGPLRGLPEDLYWPVPERAL